jgi:hypothetical protein
MNLLRSCRSTTLSLNTIEIVSQEPVELFSGIVADQVHVAGISRHVDEAVEQLRKRGLPHGVFEGQ